MRVRFSHFVLPVLLLTAPSAVGAGKRNEAEEAYQQARRAYYALKDDASRRKLRHHWLNVAHRFEAVATRFPKSERAPDALFTAGDLLQELSRISFVEGDLQAAIADYSKLVEAHPKHRLADDAALALARIHVNRLDKPEAARKILNESLATNPKGDQAKELKSLLASLPPPSKTPPAKPTVKPLPPVVKSTPDTAVAAAPPSSPLVDAISKLAREPSPVLPRLDPAVPVSGSETASKDSTANIVDAPTVADAKAPEAVASSHGTSQPSKPEARVEVPAVASKAPALVVDTAPVAPKPAAPVAVASKGETKPAAPEAPRPVTAPVDAQVAQARLKAVAKQSRHAELTLAEQLGLKVRRVVIDAGHGGHDSGAIGKAGTKEKDVALAISKKVADGLREKGLEVVLTRDDDTFIRLEDRAKLANEAHGDLFISVHCNSAATHKLRGIETYTLNTSADRYSIRLAARENASSEKGISDLQFILADLATKANTEESSRLANAVQHNLVTGLAGKYDGIKDLGHKEALFYVLLGAKMPAILVETSFLSHAEEEKRLASERYQDDVAKNIVLGVEEFLGDRRRMAKVD
ncbi:N-acetylmuramoyl-L-alanine amidase domain-containing protein [Corallococcus coralloides DSM 2259]|uniref:N-acetylmuramoyl-L-alanine amidase n=1 Tax=Corallococcus coralloides (strain ATCC 25202 / DSM 2259 / NBRC 100086 / M2) TaxID=1144275 RepID=H8MX97_CORCM|nr:N-acetylmuramoyl-L-alanine amidase [Corallococcus coralloides]AFE08037.1 N-acetylmuramoyl-L-alanine amidase domain-containing protein [Corallococcus coralloides DSM 2259]